MKPAGSGRKSYQLGENEGMDEEKKTSGLRFFWRIEVGEHREKR
jgi:hypothetical protein